MKGSSSFLIIYFLDAEYVCLEMDLKNLYIR